MKNITRRIWCILLAACMVLSVLPPVTVRAESAIPYSSTAEAYLSQCTAYRTYLTLRMDDENSYIKTLPCSRSTCEASDDVRKAVVDETLTADAIYQNTEGNYWYRVRTQDNLTGFVYGGSVAITDIPAEAITSAVKLATYTPAKGKSVNISGSVTSNYLTIKEVTATLSDAAGASYSQTITSGFGDIANTAINNNLKFGKLSRGPGVLEIYVKAAFYAVYQNTLVSQGYARPMQNLYFTVTETYQVIYDANGGTGGPGSQNKPYGTDVTVPASVPARSGYQFLGWALSKTATTPDYYPGDTLSMDVISGNITLYAVWAVGGIETSGTCGENLTWSFDTSSGVLTISGTGEMTDYTETEAPWEAFLDQIRGLIITDGVTSISDWAFNNAFYLADVSFADTVASIGAGAFQSCVSLQTVWIPANVHSIGYSAFNACTSLTEIVVDSANPRYYSWNSLLYTEDILVQVPAGYTGSLELHEFTHVIAKYAVANCAGLTELILPASVREIQRYAFGGNNALKKIEFLGDAPIMQDNLFDGFSGSIYYPHENTTWTYEVRTAVGGDISWASRIDDKVAYGYCGETAFLNVVGEFNGRFLDCIPAKNVSWTLTSDGTLTISGTGKMMDCSFLGNHPWITIMENDDSRITRLVIEEGITNAGEFLFVGYCPNLTEVILPSSLETIARGAFTTMRGLKSVEIPAAVRVIRKGAFADCTALAEVKFLGSAPNFAEDTFENVVATAYYPANDATWTADVMQQYGGTITWEPYGNEDDGDIVASGTCGDNLTWELDSNGVLTISGNGDMYNFEWCDAPWYEFSEKMTDLRILEGVTSIGYNAFNNCRMNSVSLPDSLIRIAEDAFAYCFELSEITIPENVEQIGAHPFRYCQKLAAIHVDPDNRCFITDESGVVFDPAFKTVVMAPNTISGHYAIPEGVETIGNGAFYTCSNLTGVAIPDSVKTIGEFAFASSGLSEVTIPEGVTHIFYCAFNFCSDLTEVTFLGDAPYFSDGVFSYVTATAWYPAGNPTWTAYVMQNCAETITWKPYVDGTVITSGWSGATTWKLYDNGTLMVFGNGNMKNYDYAGGQPWLDKGVDITNVIVTEGVTGIGSGAFRNLTTLKSVTLPATTLTKMGEAAFYGSGLESVEIPASLWTIQPYTFKNCTSLKSVKFNEGNLQKISDGAFYGTGLTEVVLPDCLDILDTFAFKGCADLASITIGSGLTELREAVFYGTAIPTITIPEGITKIGPYAFKLCTKLETIHLPESLTSVGEASFYDCAALTAIELPDAVTDIGNYAFRRCTGLTSVTFGERLTTIGESSFYGCTGIPELTIPDSVTTIKGYAFKGCTGLTAVTLGSSVETLGESAFHTCTSLNTIVFPASVKSIGDYCFSGSTRIKTIEFLGNAPTIGDGAFNKITAIAWYPGDNSTWTADVMQNYGGDITWEAN